MKNFGFTPHVSGENSGKGLPLTFFRRKKGEGFTLIEFTIYIAITGIISALMIGFLWNIVFGNIKETAYQEVQQNARFALTKITQEIKKAAGIDILGPDNYLSLTMANANLNPTVFDIVDEKLRITYCSGCPDQKGPYDLTSDQVVVSNLKFIDLSYPDTPGTIQIEMTIEHINPANQIEYLASINLKSTVSLVQ